MRIRFTLIILLASLLTGCTSTNTTLESDFPSVVEPMELFIDSEFSNGSNLSTAVAKVYRGNGFTQSGVFISPKGLFATNFPIALEQFNTVNTTDLDWLIDGFIADISTSELPLPGVKLMIEIEQIDISDKYNNLINSNSTNRDIAQIKQSVTQQIIQAEKTENPNTVIQINELFNGHRFILSKYQVINDVRLVFAPQTGITSEDITDTNLLLSKISNLPVFLRAYVGSSGEPATFNNSNTPFSPPTFLEIEESSIQFSPAQILGFPERSYRLDPNHALSFYNQSTNPNIIQSYSAYLAKEERLAWKNPLYAYRSIANRLNIQTNINYYQSVQQSFESDSIIDRKKESDNNLVSIIRADSLTNDKYGSVFTYLNEAYDIANRQGASFYASSYFLALSQLDEFAKIVRVYLNSSESNSINATRLLKSQAVLLSRTNIQEELLQLAEFVSIFNNLPENQKPFTIQDIFEDNPTLSSNELSELVLTNFGNETALFDSTKLASSIAENTLAEDPLFILLDEIIFAQDMSRNNQSIFIAYAQPVQKVYNDAIRNLYEDKLITSDANGNLRTNSGAITSKLSDHIIEGLFNFTTKAFGSTVISENGELIGIIGDQIPTDMSSNYLFIDNPQSYSIIDISSYIDEIRDSFPSSSVLEEIDN